MVTRVQLDASHVSRCVTVRREKVQRYIRDSNELLRYARFRILLYACENLSTLTENFARFLRVLKFSLSILVVQSLTWASERDRSQRRRSVFLQVLEVNQSEGRKLTRRKVDPGLTRQGSCVLVNRQDHQVPTVGPCKTCSHPQREFLEFLQFLFGCVLVQPFSTVHSSFVR